MGKNGEMERELYSFLLDLREELNEATDEKSRHSSHSREALAGLCDKLKKSISALLEALDKPVESWQEEVIKMLVFSDLDKETTLNYCLKGLEDFLEENPDLDMDLEVRIKNKLKKIKSPASNGARHSPEAI